MEKASTAQPSRTRKKSPLAQAAEFLYRHGVYVLVVSVLAFSAGRSLLPTEIFASEGERVQFLATIGEPESTRIIALVTEWCPACRSLEQTLAERRIKYARLDIEKDQHGREVFERVYAATGSNTIPKIILDRSVVSRAQLFLLNQK